MRPRSTSGNNDGDASYEHFHHDDPRQKEITIAQAVLGGWPKQRILDEVAKCHVLCANCHAKHHWNERIAMRDRK
jgi:hypothetical protein